MTPIRINCTSNQQWREERSRSVGASAIGTIIGVSRFQTAAQLQAKMKAELRGEYDYRQTTAMRRGHYYEGGVAQWFADETGYQIIQSSAAEYIVRQPNMPFLHCSPDREYWIDDNKPKNGKFAFLNKGILECKTTRTCVYFNHLPHYWLLQLQCQMGITECHHGHLAWDQLHKAEGFGWAQFPYDEEVFRAIVKVADYFWYRCVIGDVVPPPPEYYQQQYPCLFAGDWMHPVKYSANSTAEVVAPLTATPTQSTTKGIFSWFDKLLKRL